MADFRDDADKKKRSSNWDSAEIAMLQQLVNDNIVVLRSKLTNTITNSKKNAIWKDIATKINALGLHFRTEKEVKTKWQNLQTKAKKEYAENMKYTSQTGGGPAPKPLSTETETIVDMMKDCSSFVGLKGSESSIVIVNHEDSSNTGIGDSDSQLAPATLVTEAIGHRADFSGNDSILSLPPPATFSTSTPYAAKKRKSEIAITHDMLMKKQYDVLNVQEEKFKYEIEKIKLENIKLGLEIRRLKQWEVQEDEAVLALAAINQ